MSGNVCREVRREIDQSELRPSLSAASEAHLSVCGACAKFSKERLRLRELVGGLPPVTAPADFEMRLRARIARERDLPKQSFIFRLVMSTPAIVVAAILVVAVGLAVFISQRNRSQNATVASDKNPVVIPAPAPIVQSNENDQRGEPTVAVNNDGGDKSRRSSGPVKNLPKPFVNDTPQVFDSSARRAESVPISDPSGGVSLSAPTRPMVVTMYDEHGGARKIQLPPISFGSQRLTDGRTPVSMTNTKDW